MASVLVLPKRSLATGSNIYWRIPFTSSCGAFQVPFNRLCRSQSSCFTVVPKFLNCDSCLRPEINVTQSKTCSNPSRDGLFIIESCAEHQISHTGHEGSSRVYVKQNCSMPNLQCHVGFRYSCHVLPAFPPLLHTTKSSTPSHSSPSSLAPPRQSIALVLPAPQFPLYGVA